jgi:hypothetical protein
MKFIGFKLDVVNDKQPYYQGLPNLLQMPDEILSSWKPREAMITCIHMGNTEVWCNGSVL